MIWKCDFDPSHLHQVVWNLCENALKYGETRGGVKRRDQARPDDFQQPAIS